MNIIESIKNHYDDFSKSELKVAEYIIKTPERVEVITITKLATEAGTSTSAVLRFCQTLGFNGYKDFRFEMVNFIHEQKKEVKPNSLIDNLVDGYMKSINQMRDIDSKSMNELVDVLTNDNLNYILGIFYSSLPARELYLGLNDLGHASMFADDYMISEHITRPVNDDSTVVLFSIDGNKHNFKNYLADLATSMPKNSFLITMNPKAELAADFPHTIVLPERTFSSKSVVDTQSIPMVFVELLLNLIYGKN
ncbi:MurR/RpiR family transcriptional regulator [Companilactobacillus muriivasis]|uniref:MurR/RpiR family transcriptional regulator n=1 Tax=Companilactobacillus muriivasis TaxID=3081444 RepID=UPI0030C6CF6E